MDYAAAREGSPVVEYLENRGIPDEAAKMFGLGYVDDPHPGHEMYRGMMCIPYLRYAENRKTPTVVSVRFRCILDHEHSGHGKYNTTPGDHARLFNTRAIQEENDRIAITEGELDAVVATIAGLPAVGVPGATSWQDHFREPFLGYHSVYVLADGDEPGLKFGHNVAKTLPNSKVIPSPPGYDVSSYVLEFGAEALMERIR